MSFNEPERITNPLALRAMSHPVRLSLLEALRVHGALTATQAAEIVGESPANCSFHLRTLAKYGFVEEAQGGRGRQRPWQAVRGAREIPDAEELGDEAGMAVEALTALMVERIAARHRDWLATRARYPKQWRSASILSTLTLNLTAEELSGLGEQIHRLLEPFATRAAEQCPPDALPASFSVQGFPLRPPKKD